MLPSALIAAPNMKVSLMSLYSSMRTKWSERQSRSYGCVRVVEINLHLLCVDAALEKIRKLLALPNAVRQRQRKDHPDGKLLRDAQLITGKCCNQAA